MSGTQFGRGGRATTLISSMAISVATMVVALAAVSPALAASELGLEPTRQPAAPRADDEFMSYAVAVRNIGADPTSGTTTVSVGLPAGFQIAKASGDGWTCHLLARACTSSSVVAAGGAYPVLGLELWIAPASAPDVPTVRFAAFGGGAASDALADDTFAFAPALPFGIASFTAGAFDAFDAPATTAGEHPFSADSALRLSTRMGILGPNWQGGGTVPVESPRNLLFELPAGFVANPQAATACAISEVTAGTCPVSAAVGGVHLNFAEEDQSFAGDTPLYRVVPEHGYPAAFAFRPVSISGLTFVLRPKLRSGGDYGVTVISPLAANTPPIIEISFATLCNFGAKPWNTAISPAFNGCNQPGDPDAFDVAFLTNPTDCPGTGLVTRALADSYEHPGAFTADGFPDAGDSRWKVSDAVSPPTTDCDDAPFAPSMTIVPTNTQRDGASGLDVDLTVPQDGLLSPTGRATAHLRKTVVELPEGFSVNPSAATGLQACSDVQMAKERLTAPDCPEASKLGTVEVTSPLVDQPLSGHMYLGEPKSTDPASGEMLRLWVAVRNDALGLSAKLPGSTVADPQTGRLTATFDQNPRVPFDSLEVDLKGGGRGVLANPQDCGEETTSSTLSPWSGTAPVEQTTDTTVGGDCSEKFAPRLAAGSSNDQGRGSGGVYSFKFSREDGEQWLRGLTATLPKGLLASVKDVPLCSNVAADAGSCPADSRIGVVDAKAGAGDPFVLEQKGEVFLTAGYKGGEYGLAVKVRPVAGPFRGDMELSPIIVRQAIHVDRTTAQVTAISDPFPIIHHGIPLRVREVNVLVNRGGFMLNPSDCEVKQTGAVLLSTENATANLSDPFQVSGCSGLAFEPKLALSLTGRKQTTTGKHPGIKAVVTQAGTSEAGIEKAVVRLPKSLALDVNNAQALCEFVDGTKPDLENHCPAGSIVGRARAKTPLLKDDLVGNVYFVKNVRKDPMTGNLIRTLPMVIVALRGEISVNLKGESDTTKAGKLVNTFASVPDAPISQFNLNIKGGSKGIIAVTRTRRALINICAGRHVAEADMDGHNGRRHDRDIRMKTPCTKKQTKAAKRQVRRAAAGRGR